MVDHFPDVAGTAQLVVPCTAAEPDRAFVQGDPGTHHGTNNDEDRAQPEGGPVQAGPAPPAGAKAAEVHRGIPDRGQAAEHEKAIDETAPPPPARGRDAVDRAVHDLPATAAPDRRRSLAIRWPRDRDGMQGVVVPAVRVVVPLVVEMTQLHHRESVTSRPGLRCWRHRPPPPDHGSGWLRGLPARAAGPRAIAGFPERMPAPGDIQSRTGKP